MSHLESLGITFEQFHLVNALCEQDNISQVTQAATGAADRTSLTRLLAGTDGAGLVSRDADQDDSRVDRVRLTDKGRQIQGEVIPHWDMALDAAGEGSMRGGEGTRAIAEPDLRGREPGQ